MIISTVIILIILTVPITFKIKAMLSISEKKLYYSVSALKILKINCGYLDLKDGSIKLIYNNNKLKYLTFNDLLPNSDSVNTFKHFNLLKSSSAVLLGEDADDYKYYICALINSLNPVAYKLLSEIQPYLKFKNDVILLDSDSSSGALGEFTVSTNALSIISIAVKKILSKKEK